MHARRLPAAMARSFTRALEKNPVMYVAVAAVALNTMAMTLTGGAPKPYEVRELSSLMAELGGAEAAAEPAYVPPTSLVAQRAHAGGFEQASLSTDLLGGDLLGGRDSDRVEAPGLHVARARLADLQELSPPHPALFQRAAAHAPQASTCSKKCAAIETAAADATAVTL